MVLGPMVLNVIVNIDLLPWITCFPTLKSRGCKIPMVDQKYQAVHRHKKKISSFKGTPRLAAITIGALLLAISGAAVVFTDKPETSPAVITMESVTRSHTPAALTERLQTVALPVTPEEDLVTEDQLTQALAGIVTYPDPAARIAELEARIVELENQLTLLTEQYTGLSDTVATLQALIDDLTTRVTALEAAQSPVTTAPPTEPAPTVQEPGSTL